MRSWLLHFLLGASMLLAACRPPGAPGPPGPPPSPAPPPALLEERLSDFERANPGLMVIVRIKDESGQAGLLETLSAAAEAAPGSMPGLIAPDAAGVRAPAPHALNSP